MLAYIHSAAIYGIDAIPVRVEVNVESRGMPGWHMVGLIETAVREARERVPSAIRNSGLALPNRKTTINFSPADIKKGGTHFDLPIAIGLLKGSGILEGTRYADYMFAGELSLTGRLCRTRGIFLMAMAAKNMGMKGIIVPEENEFEASMSEIDDVIAIKNLSDTVSFLNDGIRKRIKHFTKPDEQSPQKLDMSEVNGQSFAKRGLEIAAAGGHNVALKGPPGTGKTMLVERLTTILPPPNKSEELEILKIMSCHGNIDGMREASKRRPFRAPHHSASYAGLIGGGAGGNIRIGEVTLAHCGVLFMDELAEFKGDVLEALRQPLESGKVTISRSGMSIVYPARFMLAAAFNPCRCGYLTHPTRPCTCSMHDIKRYRSKLSGPLMDRIDIHIEVSPPPHEAIIEHVIEESSDAIAKRVADARQLQMMRYGSNDIHNAHLSGRQIHEYCPLGMNERSLLKSSSAKMHLSGRALHKIIKLSRTIADLDKSESIHDRHIAEALQFRPTLNLML